MLGVQPPEGTPVHPRGLAAAENRHTPPARLAVCPFQQRWIRQRLPVVAAALSAMAQSQAVAHEVFRGRLRTMPESLLFSDTESTENLAEQIVGGVLAGDRPQGALRQAQFLGEQFELR